MKLTKWLIFGMSMIVASALVGGLMLWRRSVDEARKLAYAQELLKSDRAADAVNVIEERLVRFGSISDKWLEVDIEARRQVGHLERLREIYYEAPAAFENKEQCALLVGRALVDNNDLSGFRRLADSWDEKTEHDAEWLILRADAFLKSGHPKKAMQLLAAEKCTGSSDCLRLVRLAILNAENPQRAWKYLDDALAVDPRNSAVRSYRGQLREATEDFQLARIEYVAAYVADPQNPLMCDQLAEFYRRQANYRQMLETWAKLPTEFATDFIQLKYNFWTRVSLPSVNEPPVMTMPASGELESVVSLIGETAPHRFWPSEKIERRSELPKLVASRRQEVFWLKTLQAICDDDYVAAQKYLREMTHGQQSWNRSLERALRQTLNYRSSHQELDPDSRLSSKPVDKDPTKHSFLVDLDAAHAKQRLEPSFELPRRLAVTLEHPDAFALACVACGWLSAADKLFDGTPWPAEAPDYAPFALTQMLRVTQGPQVALDYAKNQPNSDSLSLLQAEIQLSLGDAVPAEKTLRTLATQQSDIGDRAAWLWTIQAMESEQYDEAARRVAVREAFQQSTAGRELSGRIAIFRGDETVALECYSQIEEQSVEAKAYLARRAFAEQDWDRAESLTRQLLDWMPHDPQLHANLEAIHDARKSPTPTP